MLTRKQRAQLLAETPTPNRIAAAMQLAGVTQVQVAEAVGLTQGYVSKLARGQYTSELPGDTMRRFADLFGCAIEDLFPSRQAVA